jgi:signal transduction histidine kinase
VKSYFLKLSIKLRLFLPILLGVVVLAFVVTFIAIRVTIKNANASIEENLRHEVTILSKMFERERALKLEKVKADLKVAHELFYSGSLAVSDKKISMEVTNQITGKRHHEQLNVFYLNGKPIHKDFSFVDKLQELLGGTVTIFQKADSGYVRISTNVPDREGYRATGTYIPNESPVIEAIENGAVYYGRAYVVNDWYITAYEPIYYNGNIIGILYMGDKEKNLTELQDIFSGLSIGETGYPFVIDNEGKMVIHPRIDAAWEEDTLIINKVINSEYKQKLLTVKNKEDRRKVAYTFFDPFKVFIIAVITPRKETSRMTRQLIRNGVLTGMIIVIVFLLFVYFITTENVHQYLRELEISNKKLMATREALEQTEKLATMGQLSAGIAHAVNNPLGVITMHAHILKEEVNKDSTIFADLDLITQQAERCKNVLSGLLNFARTSEVIYQETDLHEMISLIREEINVPEGMDFKVIKKINNPTAYFDTRQIMQAIKHLLNNAFEAAGDNGKVEFIIETFDKKILFVISDNGQGIHEENKGKLFEPFFTTKESVSGAGLGLPVCYGIIKMHRGKIKVESNDNPDKGDTGTKFIVEIPVENDHPNLNQ